MLCEPSIAHRIAVAFGVLAAVKLDYESFLSANKIDDMGPDRVLTHEFESTKRSRTEVPPKLLFSLVGISSQSPGQPRIELDGEYFACPLRQARGHFPVSRSDFHPHSVVDPNSARDSLLPTRVGEEMLTKLLR